MEKETVREFFSMSRGIFTWGSGKMMSSMARVFGYRPAPKGTKGSLRWGKNKAKGHIIIWMETYLKGIGLTIKSTDLGFWMDKRPFIRVNGETDLRMERGPVSPMMPPNTKDSSSTENLMEEENSPMTCYAMKEPSLRACSTDRAWYFTSQVRHFRV